MINKDKVDYIVQKIPNIEEITVLLEKAFEVLTPEDEKSFEEASCGQNLNEWFDVDKLKNYLEYGVLVEARIEEKLVGVGLIIQHNPLSWPDGRKMEVAVIAVNPKFRNKGIGTQLMKEMEVESRKMKAKKVILNTHILLTADHKFYEKLGYQRMGILQNYYDNGDAVFYCKNLE